MTHTCSADPVHVEVQVRTRTTPYDNFVFNGIASGQTDDDENKYYGGVIYLYNSTHVRFMAPNTLDYYSGGHAIFSGDYFFF